MLFIQKITAAPAAFWAKTGFAALILSLVACNLTKEVDLELPEYSSQPVVECYLEPGKPMSLLLTKSSSYFEPLGDPQTWLAGLLLDSALVTIEYPVGIDTLKNGFFFDFLTGKITNYQSSTVVQPIAGIDYKLKIRLKNGQEIEAETRSLPAVRWDSIVVEWKPDRDSLARVLAYMVDDLTVKNFYRRQFHEHSLDSLAEQDFTVDDSFFDKNLIVFGTSYEYKEGDTIFNTIYHIDKPYFDFKNSVDVAAQANLNPFGQPSGIKSNVSGSANPLGIFTFLSYDRVRTILKK